MQSARMTADLERRATVPEPVRKPLPCTVVRLGSTIVAGRTKAIWRLEKVCSIASNLPVFRRPVMVVKWLSLRRGRTARKSDCLVLCSPVVAGSPQIQQTESLMTFVRRPINMWNGCNGSANGARSPCISMSTKDRRARCKAGATGVLQAAFRSAKWPSLGCKPCRKSAARWAWEAAMNTNRLSLFGALSHDAI